MQREPQSVAITGAGAGIGRALAIESGRRGMRVALIGRREETLIATAGLITSPHEPLIVRADITHSEDRMGIVAQIQRSWGVLHILVNNAGVVTGGPVETLADEVIDMGIQTNVVAPMKLTRDLIPLLIESGAARIVNIGSVFGDIAYPGFALYCASKFAIRGFSDALRRELRHTGVRVTYCAPRATLTDAASAFDALIARTNMTLDAPAAVASHIWNGVAAGRDRIFPPGRERLFVLIEKLFPGVISRALASQLGRTTPSSTMKDIRL